MSLIKHYVDGKIFDGSSKRTSKVFNPSTGEESAKVILASKADVDFAVKKAKAAFTNWSNKPPVIRARVLFKFKEIIEKNSDLLTKLIVAEHGKVYDDAKGSLNRGLEVVEFACGIPQLLKGEFTENVGTDVDCAISKAFPFATPSATSKRTTSASSFVLIRCANVPPIWPAPINEIFFLMTYENGLIKLLVCCKHFLD